MSDVRFNHGDLEQRSYHIGMIYAFAECVGSGVKRLGLSPPLDDDEYEDIKRVVEAISEDFDIVTYVDRDFIETLLFNPEYTRDKIVIHLADNRKTIEEYKELKEDKRRYISQDSYDAEAEDEIAWRLGKLLSYSDDAIRKLFEYPRF